MGGKYGKAKGEKIIIFERAGLSGTGVRDPRGMGGMKPREKQEEGREYRSNERERERESKKKGE